MGMLSTSGAYAESQSHHVGRRRVRRCAFSSVPLAHPVVGQFQRVRSSARRLRVKRTPWPDWPVSRQQPRVPAHHAHPPGWTRAGAGAQSRRVAVGPEWPSRRYQTAQLSWVGMRWSPEAVAGHVRTLACRSSLAALPTASDVERRRSSPASQREKTRGK